MPRVLLYLIGIPLLLVVAAVLLLPLVLDEDRLVALATDTLEQRSGARLEVRGQAGLSLFPRLALRLTDTALQLPGEGQPDISVRELSVEVFLRPLLSREVVIKGLELDGLVLTLPAQEAAPDADPASFSDAQLDAFYAARQQAMREAAETGAGAVIGAPLALNVASLRLTDARVIMQQPAGAEPRVLELPALMATDLNLEGKPASLTLQLRVPGEQELALDLATVFSASADSQVLTLQELEAGLSGATVTPLTLRATGTVRLDQQLAELELELESGPTQGNGTVRYAGLESPQVDATLRLNLLDPALRLLAGPEAATSAASAAADGDAPLPLGALRLADTRADLRIERAVLGPHTVEDLRLRLRAVEGVATFDTITGTVHGGKVNATATLNARRSTPTLTTRGELAGLDTSILLAALEAQPVLSGKANANWQLTSRGNSRNALVSGLEGDIRLDTESLALEQLGVERMLCKVIAQVNQQSMQTELPERSDFDTLSVRIRLAGGEALLDPLQATLPHLGLRGDGKMDLLSNDFVATFQARLAPSLGELDPACRVNERLTAIDWPVECRGQLGGEPGDWCRVDSEAIIADLARNELESKVKEKGGRLLERLLKR
ncbi:MAG: AsmA family protein [Haliea sp.]|uniref:AsmA family protein n=1 Tax=Haliea sp. TaxID=1932666 RepID=UPI0032EB82B3